MTEDRAHALAVAWLQETQGYSPADIEVSMGRDSLTDSWVFDVFEGEQDGETEPVGYGRVLPSGVIEGLF